MSVYPMLIHCDQCRSEWAEYWIGRKSSILKAIAMERELNGSLGCHKKPSWIERVDGCTHPLEQCSASDQSWWVAWWRAKDLLCVPPVAAVVYGIQRFSWRKVLFHSFSRFKSCRAFWEALKASLMHTWLDLTLILAKLIKSSDGFVLIYLQIFWQPVVYQRKDQRND